MAHSPRIGYYGDDFTGATDALAQFSRFGLRSILLLGIPQEGEPLSGEDHDVVGLAGISRSLPVTEMEAEVAPALTWLRDLGCEVVQYKLCSTFDSSPRVGSLGLILEIGRRLLTTEPVPIVPAQPEFGRFTAFGNHFARAEDRVYRLDRHPTMSVHPSTPMREADLRRHLADQTDLPIELVDLRVVTGPRAAAAARWQQLRAEGAPGVVFDTVEQEHLVRVGEVVWPREDALLFAMGSGGLSYGLGAHLTGRRPEPSVELPSVGQILVVSGSLAPETRRQIAAAAAGGWTVLELAPAQLVGEADTAVAAVIDKALIALEQGKSVIVHTTADGPSPGGPQTTAPFHARPAQRNMAQSLGHAFGTLLRSALATTPVRRIVIAGGDVSGYTMRALDAHGLEVAGILTTGGPVCRIRSTRAEENDVEVVLKGGQVGDDDFFELARRGHEPS